ncbi:MAG: hypothetical protein VYE68_06635 [Acidobacteriota bacterium]|nr:hypothetical protein [Acidobacteriota bacterium]
MAPQTLRVGLAFGRGATLVLGGLLVGIPGLGGLGLFVGRSALWPVVFLGLVCVVGGVHAGAAVNRRLRTRVAFAVAYLAGMPVTLLGVAGLETLSGHETVSQLLLGIAPGFSMSLALIGLVGVAVDGASWRHVARATSVFAGAGAAAGISVVVVVTATPVGEMVGAPLRAGGAALVWVVAVAVGGAWVGHATVEGGADRPSVDPQSDSRRHSAR